MCPIILKTNGFQTFLSGNPGVEPQGIGVLNLAIAPEKIQLPPNLLFLRKRKTTGVSLIMTGFME
jgi:hypothetical protein